MADNRKYYYLKLKESYFDDDAIVLLESMPDGILYSNILLKLYLKSLKNGGKLQLDENIPYTAQMIATLTRQQVGTVERALGIFQQLGLVEQLHGGLLYMTDIELMIGQSSTEAERKRAARLANKALPPPRTNGGHLSDIRPPELEIKKEIDIEIEKERELKTGQAPARSYGRYNNVFLSDTELDKRNIIIVAGFQGINSFGDVTTLGRGGSDTSAVARAAAFHADFCQIYTDVDGVYTADPRVVPNAKKLPEITFADMLELASQSAQVLHNRSVELAKKYHVNMEVVSSLKNIPGTKVKEVIKLEKTNIGGVANMDNFARFSLVGLEDCPGVAFKVFSLLSRHNVNVDIILQSVGRGGSKDISFTCPLSSLDDARRVLEENKDVLEYDSIEVDDNVAKISLVGAGMMTHVGVASDMFEALYDAGINIQMIATSEIRISVLVNKDDANRAIKVVHDKFFGNED